MAALLQGVHAFAGWPTPGGGARATPDVGEEAIAQIAARLQVDRGLPPMERSGALTMEGRCVVAVAFGPAEIRCQAVRGSPASMC
jgi:hypothetical protein